MDTKKIYRHLMTGVSAMIPFVVVGGILIASAFLIDSFSLDSSDLTDISNFGDGAPLAAFIKKIGGIAMSFMLPILGGFIAYSIADKPGFVPGFIAGSLAGGQYFLSTGFLGAILGGFAAGYIILLLKDMFKNLPKSMAGLKPVLIFPLLSSIAIILVMLVVSVVFAPVNTWLTEWLKSTNANANSITGKIIIGLIAGAMMAVDMGGPINKAAYVAGVASLEGGRPSILMATVMVAGMTPPLATALATIIFPSKFNTRLKEAGKTNWVMGLSFITEGAIPFAAAKPKIVIPSIIVGSGIAGATSAILGAASRAPHGGLFVLPIIGNPFAFLIAMILGTVVSALMMGYLLPTAEVKETK